MARTHFCLPASIKVIIVPLFQRTPYSHLRISTLVAIWGAFTTLVCWSTHSSALPISFGMNQGQIEYQELTSPHFHIYFDARVPYEGVMIAQSIEGVRPLMEHWLKISRKGKRPLKVVSSPVSEGASFANFIYDAIELQTMDQNIRDLAWHEYIHTLTYEFYQNLLSPPGTIIHIMWMPAWFLEGLAESLSVSVGSDYQSGVERWQALTNQWPSYDRLHSLYLNYKWSLRGYATAGSFVSWILKDFYSSQGSRPTLTKILHDFKKHTMPWHLPFGLFNPMGKTLKTHLGKSGSDLYKIYQRQAHAYWSVASPYPLLVRRKNPPSKRRFFGGHSLPAEVKGRKLMLAGNRHQYYVQFDKKTGWASDLKTLPDLPQDALSHSAIRTPTLHAYILAEKPQKSFPRSSIVIGKTAANLHTIWRGQRIDKLFHTASAIGWVESTLSKTRICTLAKSQLSRTLKSHRPLSPKVQPKCHIIADQTKKTYLLGSHMAKDGHHGEIRALWFATESSSLTGDLYKVFVWTAKDRKIIEKAWHPLLKPIHAAFVGSDIWMLSSDRSQTYLAKVDIQTPCIETMMFSDFILGAWGLGPGKLALRLYEGFNSSILLLDPNKHPKYPCPTPEPHSSPMLDGMRALVHYSQKTSLSGKKSPKKLIANIPSIEAVIFRTHPWKIRHYKEFAYKYITSDQGRRDKNRSIRQSYRLLNPDHIAQRISTYNKLTQSLLSHKDRHLALLNTPIFGSSKGILANGSSPRDIRPYSARWSAPVFFPWIGPNDIGRQKSASVPTPFLSEQNVGSLSIPLIGRQQVGIISVPLIDDLQNHTLRGTALIGLSSFFPDLALTYNNTRYSTPITVDLFNRLLYNGFVPKFGSSYLYEYGGKLSLGKAYRIRRGVVVSYKMGWQSSYLQTYTDPQVNPEGLKNEPFVSLGLFVGPRNFRFGTTGSISYAAPLINEIFNYHKSRLKIELTRLLYPFGRKTSLKLSSAYSQTRGDQPLYLRELYAPIQTFIPGAGTSQGRQRIPLLGVRTTPVYFGDTTIMNSAIIVTPIIADLDKQMNMFYAERLDLSLFVNWGRAWYSFVPPPPSIREFILTYAGTVDLHLENKGVSVYAGIGLGHLVQRGTSLFCQFGFSALF